MFPPRGSGPRTASAGVPGTAAAAPDRDTHRPATRRPKTIQLVTAGRRHQYNSATYAVISSPRSSLVGFRNRVGSPLAFSWRSLHEPLPRAKQTDDHPAGENDYQDRSCGFCESVVRSEGSEGDYCRRDRDEGLRRNSDPRSHRTSSPVLHIDEDAVERDEKSGHRAGRCRWRLVPLTARVDTGLARIVAAPAFDFLPRVQWMDLTSRMDSANVPAAARQSAGKAPDTSIGTLRPRCRTTISFGRREGHRPKVPDDWRRLAARAWLKHSREPVPGQTGRERSRPCICLDGSVRGEHSSLL